MPSRRSLSVVVVVLWAVAAVPAGRAAVPVRYDVVEIGTPGIYINARDLDAAGEAVGTLQRDSNRIIHAFRRTATALVDLGTDGEQRSEAWGTNDLGDAVGEVGSSVNNVITPAATIFRRDGTFQRLGTLGGASSRALAINDRGDVVGSSQFDSYGIYKSPHAFLWRDGVMRDLGTLGSVPQVSESYALDINAHGEIVGESFIARSGPEHAFVWRDGVMTDLGTLGGVYSSAAAINDVGQIVGWASTSGDSGKHAVMWEQGAIRDLGTLNGEAAEANDVNNHGDAVGRVGATAAVLFTDGRVIDLETLVTPVPSRFFVEAVAINDAGMILVHTNGGSTTHGVVLYPVWCGNGTIEQGEACDGGPCCTSACEPAAAGTSCREAADACDAPDACDGVAGVCPADARVPDSDGDGRCDAIDACSTGAPRTVLMRTTGWTRDGDDAVLLRVVTDVAGPAPDPAATGMTVRLDDGAGQAIAAFHAPAGAGWQGANPKRAVYVGGMTDAIDRLTLSWKGADPGRLRVELRARRPGLFARVPVLPLQVGATLDGDVAFCVDTRPDATRCVVGRGGDAITCR